MSIKHAGTYICHKPFSWIGGRSDPQDLKVGNSILVTGSGGVFLEGKELEQNRACLVRLTLPFLLKKGWVEPSNLAHYNIKLKEDYETMHTFNPPDRNPTHSPTIEKQIADKDTEILEGLIYSGKTPTHAKLLTIVFARAFDALETDCKEAHRNGQRKAFQCLNKLVAMVKKLGEEVENGAMLMTQAESQALFDKLHEAGKAEFEPMSDFNKGLAKLGMSTGALDVPEGLV